MNLPVIWFPAPAGFARRAEGSGRLAILSGIFLGRHASLDCLRQAWGLWNGGTTHDWVSRTFFITVVG
jgi:hypothetical protein